MQISRMSNSIAEGSNTRSQQFQKISIQAESENKCITLPKVKCAFHPSQTITNFCTCDCCLLPLCPSCIKIHTIQHINMKKINPQYEPITQLLSDIYAEVQQLLNSNNEYYQKILQLDARVGTFRTTVNQKISSVKQSILNQVQKYFAKLDQDIQGRIDNMNYIQMIKDYKDNMKRNIMGLKNVQKSFNPDNDKIMRILIKYKGGNIKRQIQQFQNGLAEFLKQVNHNFVTFSVREDYRQATQIFLDSMKKIQLSDVRAGQPIANLSAKISEVYQKTSQQNKKQIRKSIGSFLVSSGMKKNQQNELKESYKHSNSNSQSQSQQLGNMSFNGTPCKEDSHKRSLSKGKGLSLMQINNTFMASNATSKAPRAINISSPIQFNRTTILRRDR